MKDAAQRRQEAAMFRERRRLYGTDVVRQLGDHLTVRWAEFLKMHSTEETVEAIKAELAWIEERMLHHDAVTEARLRRILDAIENPRAPKPNMLPRCPWSGKKVKLYPKERWPSGDAMLREIVWERVSREKRQADRFDDSVGSKG